MDWVMPFGLRDKVSLLFFHCTILNSYNNKSSLSHPSPFTYRDGSLWNSMFTFPSAHTSNCIPTAHSHETTRRQHLCPSTSSHLTNQGPIYFFQMRQWSIFITLVSYIRWSGLEKPNVDWVSTVQNIDIQSTKMPHNLPVTLIVHPTPLLMSPYLISSNWAQCQWQEQHLILLWVQHRGFNI